MSKNCDDCSLYATKRWTVVGRIMPLSKMSTIPVLSCEYVIGELILLNQLTLRSGQFIEISG